MTADELKAFCKERNLTYKELGELIGYSEGGIKNALSTGKISEPMEKSIKLLMKIEKLETELNSYITIKQAFTNLIKSIN